MKRARIAESGPPPPAVDVQEALAELPVDSERREASLVGLVRSLEKTVRDRDSRLDVEEARQARRETILAGHRERTVVALNVGGQTFCTTRATLVQHSDYFRCLLGSSDDENSLWPAAERDEAGAIFVDRDPTRFGAILEYMRSNTVPVGHQREALRQEAAFYGIEALVRRLGPAAQISETLRRHCPLNAALAEEENDLRERFASGRGASSELLIDVFLATTTFLTDNQPLIDELKDESVAPTLARDVRVKSLAIVPSLEVWQRQFGSFTRGCLDGLDWSNILCGGSAALAPLLPLVLPANLRSWPVAEQELLAYHHLVNIHRLELNAPDEPENATYHFLTDQPQARHLAEDLAEHNDDEEGTLRQLGRDAHDAARSSPYSTSDVDLFLYGVTAAQAEEKIRQVHAALRRNAAPGAQLTMWRTKHAVTFHVGQLNVIDPQTNKVELWCLRRVQIVLRLYSSPAEILSGFDVDCCCCGYTQGRVVCLPRARRAMVGRFNLVDPTRQSLTYESRLLKYAERGFAVKVPGLDLSRVDWAIMHREDPYEVRGLARFLVMLAKRSAECDRLRHADNRRRRENDDRSVGEGGIRPLEGRLSVPERVAQLVGLRTQTTSVDMDKRNAPDGWPMAVFAQKNSSNRSIRRQGVYTEFTIFRWILESLNLVSRLGRQRLGGDYERWFGNRSTGEPGVYDLQTSCLRSDPSQHSSIVDIFNVTSDYEDVHVAGRSTRSLRNNILRFRPGIWSPPRYTSIPDYASDIIPFNVALAKRFPIVIAVQDDLDTLFATPDNPQECRIYREGRGGQDGVTPETPPAKYCSSLPRTIEWISHDPGRQYVGSFHPLDDDYFEDAYYSQQSAAAPDHNNEATNNNKPENLPPKLASIIGLQQPNHHPAS